MNNNGMHADTFCDNNKRHANNAMEYNNVNGNSNLMSGEPD